MMMLKALIIDDAIAFRNENRIAIEKNCPNIRIIGEANSVATGIEIIKQLAPDLVFLDIDLGDGTGFDLLKKLQPIQFKVIFVSGYEDYAIKAFRSNAIDFLLKPINAKELAEAVEKATTAIDKDMMDVKLNNLFLNVERPKNLQKILLKTTEKIFSINLQDIVHCEGQSNYTTFNLIDGSKILVSYSLKDYELTLNNLGFFRPHQSHLINMAYFSYYSRTDMGYIVLKNNVKIPLSQRKKVEFLSLLEKL
ncbi:MAG: LytTR family DNA-binding domain-containing protein [Bacteroidia bacterium]